MARVLLVDDDVELSEQLSSFLRFNLYDVDVLADGADAIQLLGVQTYDVVILDWNMPGLTGVEVCRQFRATGGNTPIIMLTAQTTVTDKEIGLDAGADDYLSKPFSGKELAARLRALLRRPTTFSSSLDYGPIKMDVTAHAVWVNTQSVKLLPTEFKLLEFFVRHPTRLNSASELLSNVWGLETDAGETAVRTYVKTLRQKLAKAGLENSIETVKGVGYRLVLID